ncbi:MAG: aminodeoxychorismate synthase component I [Pseudomonadota bacterium]
MHVLLDDQATHRQLYFTDPVDVLSYRMGDPVAAFFEAMTAAQQAGHWLAGQFDYEFAAALEPRLAHLAKPGAVLARLGVFGPPAKYPPTDHLYRAEPHSVSLAASWHEADYLSQFNAVQAYLRAGDCYQVNLTFPMIGETQADAISLYAGYRRRQPGRYGAVVSLGGADMISLSPELFFERRGNAMRMRPMKGTRPKTANDDMRLDEKSRAENLMIVDLLRNDLSRLCQPGTVKVPELFAIEDYPTLIQMTSQVTGELEAGRSWFDIFRALFPCGSVTGAPKIRAMEIIHALERGPRGSYCGAVGYIAPNHDASFSVAIRTATLDEGVLRYDVGSGVVLDSDGQDEYRECLLKADVWESAAASRFETLMTGPYGPLRAERHTRRLGVPLPNLPRPADLQRLRIERSATGQITTSQQPYKPLAEPIAISVSRHPLTARVQRTDIKTSRRDFYDGERTRIQALSGADEVLFLGSDSLVKEGSFTSLFVQSAGRLLTPRGPGLLPGILRAAYLESGRAYEADLTINDLIAADALFVGNSLRGMMRATLMSPDLI